MRKSCLLLISAQLVLVSAGCRAKPVSEAPSQPAVTSASKEPASPWKIDLQVMPDHPRMVKPVTFTVHIVDGAGKTVDNAQVKGTLTMKVMDMGKNEITLEPRGNGNYEGTLKEMDMSGPWDFAIDASQGGFHALKKFEVVIYE